MTDKVNQVKGCRIQARNFAPVSSSRELLLPGTRSLESDALLMRGYPSLPLAAQWRSDANGDRKMLYCSCGQF
ncbi:MAG: hypothetical protein PHR14_07465 [Oscillospiraceae bacterium]|nr:hypothetical protein [Oscillospiraceae bacterium]